MYYRAHYYPLDLNVHLTGDDGQEISIAVANHSLDHTLQMYFLTVVGLLILVLPAPLGEVGEDAIDMLPPNFAEDCP